MIMQLVLDFPLRLFVHIVILDGHQSGAGRYQVAEYRCAPILDLIIVSNKLGGFWIGFDRLCESGISRL